MTVTVGAGDDDVGAGLGVAVGWAGGGAGAGDEGTGLDGGAAVPVSVTAGACVVLNGAVVVGSVGLGAFVAVVELVELVELVEGDGVAVSVGSEGAGSVDGDMVGSVGAGEVVSVEAGAGVVAVLGSGATVTELLGVVQVGAGTTDEPWLAEGHGLDVNGSAWAIAAAAGAVTRPAMTTASRT